MRKRAFLLGLICLLSGCTAMTEKPKEIYQRNLTIEEQQIVGNLGYQNNENAFFWEFRAPDGTTTFTCWMEYYQQGQKVQFEEGKDSSLPLSEKQGEIAVSLQSVYNQVYKTNLGTVDFFDEISNTQWNISCISGRNSSGSIFSTGYDLLQGYPRERHFDIRFGCVQGPLTIEAGKELTLLCYGLSDGISGNDLDVEQAQSDPEFYQAFEYAYAFKCRFD